MTKRKRKPTPTVRKARLKQFARHYAARSEQIDLTEFDWSFACYLAKRGDLSELVSMLRDASSLYKPPTPRARRVIASLLEHRGVFKKRSRLTPGNVETARYLFRGFAKQIPSKKKRYFVIAKYFDVAESTIRDAITGKRDFAGF